MTVLNRRKKEQQQLKTNDSPIKKKTKSNKNKENLSSLKIPFVCAVISTCLTAFIYFVLLNENNLVPFSKLDDSSAYFLTKEIDNRKWGTFRSGHYFGLKTLAERSTVFGLMWFENRIIDNNVRIRHWCDQSDGLTKYGWLKHDFHSFGIQEIVDNDINIKTSFLTNQNHNQSNWRARIEIDFNDKIKNQIRQQEKRVNSTKIRINKELSLLPYFALDGSTNEDDELWVSKKTVEVDQYSTGFEVFGRTKVFKNGFRARIIVENKDLLYSNGLNRTIDPPILQVKENVLENLFLTDYPGEEMNKNKYLIILRDNLKKKKLENNSKSQKTNLVIQQIILRVPSIIHIEFVETDDSYSDLKDYDNKLKEKEQEFDLKFEEIFKLENKGYSNEQTQFAKSAFSNMIGSIGSFSGFSQVSLIEDNKLVKKENKKIKKYGPLKLLTSVPSRSFFPRGFLWDEGFHQMLISKYDLNLSKIIISSWFNLMNKNGWIPREVILGDEAEARVPEEFIVQNVHVANPPTFFLVLDSILNKLSTDKDTNESKEYFNQLFDKLNVWYNWLNRTQNGHLPGSYRWKGRNPTVKTELNVKTLSSGLDDYPRASSPTDEELHLDLFSWITYSTRIMVRLSKYLGHSSYERFNNHLNWLNSLLEKLHWSDKHQMYCDYGLHSKKVVLQSFRTTNNQLIKVRKELEPAEYGCVDEFGYVSLFPFILQLIEPHNAHLNIILDKLRDKNLLWSSFGLRSLSKNSSYYNAKNTDHDPPYWRSAIWMNINYLTLKSLDHYSNQNGPYKEKAKLIYNELKTNLINNVYGQYKKKNYLYENYDDQTGEGKGCYPFTGWTSLIVLIMADNYE